MDGNHAVRFSMNWMDELLVRSTGVREEGSVGRAHGTHQLRIWAARCSCADSTDANSIQEPGILEEKNQVLCNFCGLVPRKTTVYGLRLLGMRNPNICGTSETRMMDRHGGSV